ncbi:hypothetical protein BOTBODRAFT_101585 [Botryobasidium botryosum FD-172 SS1]|uniref:Peptidase A1 domain-containing protein n=1 Tax=Botryobasidium botryosum (strain FD-172 SS1) TaxID=930990 RepID=A0A067MWE5_BOTB1|nr:hypothetical protein BOTBODRAFT_101585 [Botryobasidium botryosum FD-172 SS1]
MPAAAFFVSLLSLTCALALPTQSTGIAIPIHKRIPPNTSPGVANIPSLRAQINKLTGKYATTLAAYKANTGQAYPIAASSTRNTTKRATSGGLMLTDAREELWFGTVSVGTPPRQYTIDFDTGSSDLFIPASSCMNCGSHTHYNPRLVSTSKYLGKTFQLVYGDGSTTSGELYSDTVTVAGLTATDQTLGAATSYSTSFETGPADGLMGLAFPSLSTYPASPFFNTLVSQKKVSAGVFSFFLAESGSELYLGGSNQARYKGPISWNTVTERGYWEIPLDSIQVDGETVVSGLQSIIDSGTTLIVGDDANVAAFYQAIPGSQDLSSIVGPGFYGFPCSSALSVSFTFGGKPFAINQQFFNLGSISEGSGTCVGALVAQDFGFWIAGDVFMRNVYSIFDFDNSRVGFAALA